MTDWETGKAAAICSDCTGKTPENVNAFPGIRKQG